MKIEIKLEVNPNDFSLCLRLDNQVNQANQSNPLGSGLGYLEHICQLIEKIGQLQEHNLRLQKQICGLQKESRVIKTKEVLTACQHSSL